MAAHATCKGTIKLSLVTIPIRVFPATTTSSDVSFRQLHRKCLTPIQLKKWCPHCNEEVHLQDIVKGYEASTGRYAVVEEAEVAALRPDTTHTVDLSHVIHQAAIEPIYVERVYFLTPDGKAAGPAFAVLREALRDRTAVGRVALHGREYLVAVRPYEQAMALFTLRTAGEVRNLDATEGLEFAAGSIKPDEVKLARQLLDHLETKDDLSGFTDHYQEALKRMLAQKTAVEVEAADAGAKPTRVVDLMAALRQSLEEVKTRRPPAKMAKAAGRVLPHTPARGKRRKAS